MSNNVHVCLISDHLLPNIIPVLMDKPEKVYAITTEKMKQQGKLFEGFLGKRKIPVVIRENAPEAPLSNIIQFVENEAREIAKDHPDSKIVLNVTGGTKLMAMAFSSMFVGGEGREVETIYTDTEHNVIEYFALDKKPSPIPSLLDVCAYLEARGFTVDFCASDEWRKNAEARRELTLFLASKMPVVSGGFVQQLNTAANSALDKTGKSLSNSVQKIKAKNDGNIILQELARRQLIEQLPDSKIKFLSHDAARYLGGVWLEEYVWISLKSLGLDDVRISVQGSWNAGGRNAPVNEFDCIVVHRNRMLFIECKTVFFGPGAKGQDILNKIDALGARAKGLFGTTLLLSALKLDEVTMGRATAYKIQILDGKKVTTLPDFVRKWMREN